LDACITERLPGEVKKFSMRNLAFQPVPQVTQNQTQNPFTGKIDTSLLLALRG
jgi:hypothetical protein